MSKAIRILWLEGIFDEHTIKVFSASSPAVNFWHFGFVKAMMLKGCDVTLIGHPYDQIWPRGRAVVSSVDARLASGFFGEIIGYLNLPFLRKITQSCNYLYRIKNYIDRNGTPDYIFTFNDTPATFAAKNISHKLGIPWIYIAGDGPVIEGADGYIYQNWSSYQTSSEKTPRIHLDGGLPELNMVGQISKGQPVKAIMYMGSLTEHGGVIQLAKAFHYIKDTELQLWITGNGNNLELEKLAMIDKRIKLYGFLDYEHLHSLASRAKIFANPRPTSFRPNKLNYPSKLLHYLAYGRPIISTFTEGLSPDYHDALILINDESTEGLSKIIHGAMNMSDGDYEEWCKRIARFKIGKTWEYQVNRLLIWLDCEFNRPSL